MKKQADSFRLAARHLLTHGMAFDARSDAYGASDNPMVYDYHLYRQYDGDITLVIDYPGDKENTLNRIGWGT